MYNVFNFFFFAHENMKKTASKVAELAQIQLKCLFLFHRNIPPRNFSIMTLDMSREQIEVISELIFDCLKMMRKDLGKL